jgi:ketosteroid isomerase-like protein
VVLISAQFRTLSGTRLAHLLVDKPATRSAVMNFCAAVVWLALWGAPSSAGVINVDWSNAIGADAPIAAVRREYATAFNAHSTGLRQLYTADAVGIFADGTAVSRALNRPVDEAFAPVTVTLVPGRFVVQGDTGSEAGIFTETGGGDDPSARVEGMYVTIYSRGADGHWRIAMELRTRGGRPPLAHW